MDVPNLFSSDGLVPTDHDVILVDADEMAARLNISKSTLLRAVRAGQIPVVRINARTVRFNPHAVMDAIQEEGLK